MSDWKGTKNPGKFNADFLARFQSPSPDPSPPAPRAGPPKRKKFGADRLAMFDANKSPSDEPSPSPGPVPSIPGSMGGPPPSGGPPPGIPKKPHRLSRNVNINLDAFRPGAKFKKKPSPSPPPLRGTDESKVAPGLMAMSQSQGDEALMTKPLRRKSRARTKKRHTFDVSSPRDSTPSKRWSVITEELPEGLDDLHESLGSPPGAFPELSPRSVRILSGQDRAPHNIALRSPDMDEDDHSLDDESLPDVPTSLPESKQDQEMDFEIPPAVVEDNENERLEGPPMNPIKEEVSPVNSPQQDPIHHPSMIEGPASNLISAGLDVSGMPHEDFGGAAVSPSPQPPSSVVTYEESEPPPAFSPGSLRPQMSVEESDEKPFRPAAVQIPPRDDLASPSSRRPPPRKGPPKSQRTVVPALTSLADSSKEVSSDDASPVNETPFQRAKRMAQQAANKKQKRNSIVTRSKHEPQIHPRPEVNVLTPQREERKPRSSTEPNFDYTASQKVPAPSQRAVSVSPRFISHQAELIKKKERLEKEIAEMERQLANQKAEWVELERASIQGLIDDLRPIELLRKMADFCSNASEEELRVIRGVINTEL